MGTDYRDNRNGLVFNCPFCSQRGKKQDTKYHLYWYANTGFLTCYRCGYKKPNVSKEKLEEVLQKELVFWEQTKRKTVADGIEVKWTDFDNGVLSQQARLYMEKRGFGYAIEPYGVKVGVEDLTGFVVFPMYHENRLVYYVARRFNQGKPKTWNPPNITAPLHGFRTVYNQRVVLVEGCFDRMAVERAGFRSFAILGSDMSDYQLKQLDKTADFVSSIVVMLDGEAEKESRKLAKKLYQRYTDTIIELALIPNREKDPGDMTNEEIQSCIKNACLYPFMKLTTYVKQRLKNA